MPRKARIDAPGALHHVICRGIERRKIYYDDADKKGFLKRFCTVLKATSTSCYAWALMTNHFHLLLRTGKVPISTVMRRLLTGYVVSFNRRHRRSGQLFQNRFKSILCQEDTYFKELVSYIHLNPLRAGLVLDPKALSTYLYSGHSVLLGRAQADFQDMGYVLGQFGQKVGAARRNYRNFVYNRAFKERRPDLVGGGLLRSNGGWRSVRSMGKAGVHLKGDERILGDSDFVKKVLAATNESFERRYQLKAKGYDLDRVVSKAAHVFEVEPGQICSSGKQPLRTKARSVVCYWAVRELGISGTVVGRHLHLSQSAVSRAVTRGERIVQDMNLCLVG